MSRTRIIGFAPALVGVAAVVAIVVLVSGGGEGADDGSAQPSSL